MLFLIQLAVIDENPLLVNGEIGGHVCVVKYQFENITENLKLRKLI
jgi:hypothetical protein